MTSRRRVFIATVSVLLVLDALRSMYARVGYADPAEPWQTAEYEALAWPPGSDVSRDATLGERVYMERCALCHGPRGWGNGSAAPSLIPRPRDFTSGDYKYKSTPADEPPTEADLLAVVRDGLDASAMPYWGDVLSEEEMLAVVRYIRDLSVIADEDPAPAPINVPARPPRSAESLTRGGTLYEDNCAECHGPDGRGDWTPAPDDEPVRIRDLTAPWTFRGGSEPDQLWLRLTTGMRPGPMPDYALTLTEEERWDIVGYVQSLARIPPWERGGILAGPGQQEDLLKRGDYLVHAEMCGLCHTQVNDDLIYSGDAYYLAGGMGVPIYPHGTFVSRNLTSDSATGLGTWTPEEVANAIRNGRTPDRKLNPFAMPWLFLHSLAEDDALAIGTYLKTLPPVTNRIPSPLRYGLVETVVAKAMYSTGLPPLGDPKHLIYEDGNFGQTEPGLLPLDWPQRLLVTVQWLALFAGVITFILARPTRARPVPGLGARIRLVSALGGTLLAVSLIWLLYQTPILPFLPPSVFNQAVTATIFEPDPASMEGPEQAALAERGRYLFTVTSCVFCHGSEGSGGLKLNAPSMGTVLARNITPHPETGIGGWSDREIARAIRSGVSRDGSPLHWQGMIWDHLSNLDEEDVRALIVYLRLLPPVAKEIPDPLPPSATDCEEYTVYMVDSEGCG